MSRTRPIYVDLLPGRIVANNGFFARAFPQFHAYITSGSTGQFSFQRQDINVVYDI